MVRRLSWRCSELPSMREFVCASKGTIVGLHLGLVALLVPGVLAGQAVRGVVVNRTSDVPVAGAFVLLEDSAGTEQRRVMTDAVGRFVVVGPVAATYRLRTMIIGYQSWESGRFHLDRGETVERRIEIELVPVVLPVLTVEADRTCRSRPEDGAATAALWQEVKKALDATQFTMAHRLYRFRTTIDDRTLNPYRQLEAESAGSGAQYSEWPFATLSPERLVRRGFVQPAPGGPVYYGPDAQLLVSDAFLDTHCFRLVIDGAPTDRLIGLGFQPESGRRVAEIEGVLWVDSATVALRRLDYHYVNLSRWVPEQHVGGAIEFDELPSGAWFIRRWLIRAPIAKVAMATGDTTLYGFRERVGSVVEVLDARGKSLVRFEDGS